MSEGGLVSQAYGVFRELSMRVHGLLPSGGEALEEPLVAGLAAEAEPVVEPARPTLPKLDSLRHELSFMDINSRMSTQ